MIFSTAPNLRQGWTEAQRRLEGRQSVIAKAENTRSQQGTSLWKAA